MAAWSRQKRKHGLLDSSWLRAPAILQASRRNKLGQNLPPQHWLKLESPTAIEPFKIFPKGKAYQMRLGFETFSQSPEVRDWRIFDPAQFLSGWARLGASWLCESELAFHRDMKKELVKLLITYMKGIVEDAWAEKRGAEERQAMSWENKSLHLPFLHSSCSPLTLVWVWHGSCIDLWLLALLPSRNELLWGLCFLLVPLFHLILHFLSCLNPKTLILSEVWSTMAVCRFRVGETVLIPLNWGWK